MMSTMSGPGHDAGPIDPEFCQHDRLLFVVDPRNRRLWDIYSRCDACTTKFGIRPLHQRVGVRKTGNWVGESMNDDDDPAREYYYQGSMPDCSRFVRRPIGSQPASDKMPDPQCGTEQAAIPDCSHRTLTIKITPRDGRFWHVCGECGKCGMELLVRPFFEEARLAREQGSNPGQDGIGYRYDSDAKAPCNLFLCRPVDGWRGG